MNKIAEILYGKVANIYNTTRSLDELKKLFAPAALLIDVTNIDDVAVGYRVDFTSETEFNLIAPAKILPETLDEVKIAKIKELKAIRDAREVAVIEHNGNTYDYDDKARERINAAIIALDVQSNLAKSTASIDWTTADNKDVKVTADDLRMVIASVAQRSNALHVAYRIAKEKVENASTKKEVEAITLEVQN